MPNPFSNFIREAGSAWENYAADVGIGRTASNVTASRADGLGRRMGGAYMRGFFGPEATHLEMGVGVAGLVGAAGLGMSAIQGSGDHPVLGAGVAVMGTAIALAGPGAVRNLSSGAMARNVISQASKTSETVMNRLKSREAAVAEEAATTTQGTFTREGQFRLPRRYTTQRIFNGVTEAADARTAADVTSQAEYQSSMASQFSAHESAKSYRNGRFVGTTETQDPDTLAARVQASIAERTGANLPRKSGLYTRAQWFQHNMPPPGEQNALPITRERL